MAFSLFLQTESLELHALVQYMFDFHNLRTKSCFNFLDLPLFRSIDPVRFLTHTDLCIISFSNLCFPMRKLSEEIKTQFLI